MTTASTTLLGLALPVTGELSGTWGDVVNASLTNLLDTAIAGTTTLSSDADVTLTTTTLSSNQARQAVILWTAGGTATRTITAPAQSKSYVVINATSSSQSIKLVGVGPTTGITIVAGEKCFAAWNGSDFVKVGNTSGAGVFSTVTASSLTSGRVTYAGTAGLLQDSANLTFNGTTLTANTIGAFTLGGTVAGGGNQLNNVVIGTTTPLAGNFTTLSASSTATLSGLTASTALALDASKNIVSVTNTGSGNNVLATSPTITGATLTTSAFNGTVGATTPSTGAFTTLSATQNVSFQKAGANTFLVENTASTANVILNLKQTTGTAALGINSTAVYFDDTAARPYVFYTNGTERARVDTTGLAVTGTLTTTSTINTLTVGRGGGAVSTNTAVGASALAANTTGDINVAVGYLALAANIAGRQCVAVGKSALAVNNGDLNVAIGESSLGSNTSGTQNTGCGSRTLTAVISGSYNSALGYSALNANTGSYNVGVGVGALVLTTTANGNTAVGYQALRQSNRVADTNAYNLGVGYQAGEGLTTGQYNTFVGGSAPGWQVTSGSKNVIIGNYSGGAAPISGSGNNYVVLSDGDGNVRAYWNGAAATFNGGLDVTGTLSATKSVNFGTDTYAGTGGRAFVTAADGLLICGVTGSSTDISLIDGSGGTIMDNPAGGVAARFASSISLGYVTPSTSGTGITFPATQSASTDANTLDDYEEGTFTPTITAITGSFTTIINQVGKYTKIGNVVNVYISFAISSIGTATTGFNAGNLQFANVAAVNSPVSGVNVSTDVPFGGYVAAGGTSIRCFATLTTTNTYNVMATYFTS